MAPTIPSSPDPPSAIHTTPNIHTHLDEILAFLCMLVLLVLIAARHLLHHHRRSQLSRFPSKLSPHPTPRIPPVRTQTRAHLPAPSTSSDQTFSNADWYFSTSSALLSTDRPGAPAPCGCFQNAAGRSSLTEGSALPDDRISILDLETTPSFSVLGYGSCSTSTPTALTSTSTAITSLTTTTLPSGASSPRTTHKTVRFAPDPVVQRARTCSEMERIARAEYLRSQRWEEREETWAFRLVAALVDEQGRAGRGAGAAVAPTPALEPGPAGNETASVGESGGAEVGDLGKRMQKDGALERRVYAAVGRRWYDVGDELDEDEGMKV
ncbi:hypothetical protein BP6252_09244 [Coleophoma cylindrospora]|uniref:Uncharacterized protein n=1 Tax=Coleophoma cylindrospora TaxID=1849047 RepID=A0A3D8R1L4_9HELO|nr:hypothetical protein BP6252_09244 [Coleophoma cylindrospora]